MRFRNIMLSTGVLDELETCHKNAGKTLKQACTNPYEFHKAFMQFNEPRTGHVITPNDMSLETYPVFENIIKRIDHLLKYANESISYQIAHDARQLITTTELPDSKALHGNIKHLARYPSFDSRFVRSMVRHFATINPASKHVTFMKTDPKKDTHAPTSDQKLLIRNILHNAIRLKPYGPEEQYCIALIKMLYVQDYHNIPDFEATINKLAQNCWFMEPAAHQIKPDTIQTILNNMPDNNDKTTFEHIAKLNIEGI